jgi:hypothetical protein
LSAFEKAWRVVKAEPHRMGDAKRRRDAFVTAQAEKRVCIRPGCDKRLSSNAKIDNPNLRQCASCLRQYGHEGLNVSQDRSNPGLRQQVSRPVGKPDPDFTG